MYMQEDHYYESSLVYICDPDNMCTCAEGYVENERGFCVEGEIAMRLGHLNFMI